MEDVVVRESDDRPDQKPVRPRGKAGKGSGGCQVEVLTFARPDTWCYLPWWKRIPYELLGDRTEFHCAVLHDGIQYHCVPLRGCIRVRGEVWEKARMPAPVRRCTVEIHRTGIWEENRPFDYWKTVLWRLHLLHADTDVMNCVTATCWLLDIAVPARTPKALMDLLMERS